MWIFLYRGLCFCTHPQHIVYPTTHPFMYLIYSLKSFLHNTRSFLSCRRIKLSARSKLFNLIIYDFVSRARTQMNAKTTNITKHTQEEKKYTMMSKSLLFLNHLINFIIWGIHVVTKWKKKRCPTVIRPELSARMFFFFRRRPDDVYQPKT